MPWSASGSTWGALTNWRRLPKSAQLSDEDMTFLAALRERDNPFPTVDYRDWAARQGYAGAAPVASGA